MRSITLCFVICLAQLVAQTPNYTISTIAGTNPSGDDGRAREARLLRPEGIAVDGQGVIYFCDRGNSRIRRVGRDQIITTIAGGGDLFPEDGLPGTAVSLFDLAGIALNASANTLYFSGSAINTIFSLNLTNGSIAVLAGTGFVGSSGDGGAAKRAKFNRPTGLAYDATLGLLIADTGNHRIRRIDLTTGMISAFAGTGNGGFTGDGAAAVASQLALPSGVAVGPGRLVYIADHGNRRVRRVKLDGTLETVAGNGGGQFSQDGPATTVGVDPFSIVVAVDGTLYIAEDAVHRIRVVTPAGVISTLVGATAAGFSGDGGLANNARLDTPLAVTLDTAGSLYVADSSNHRIRRVTLNNALIDTVAGRNRFGGDAAQAALALLTGPQDVAFDAAGNIFFADSGNHCIRRFGLDGVITTVAGIGGEAGEGAENIQATASRLNGPSSVAVDPDGSLYIADFNNLRVRKVDPSGIIRTISAGDVYGAYGLAFNARQRSLYFTDQIYNQILRLDLTNAAAVPIPIAGSPVYRSGFSGDGGPAVAALLRNPTGIAIAPNGDLYVVDTNNNRLRKIDSNGTITTVAGNGEAETVPTDGPLTGSVLSLPNRVAVDAQNNIYISESFNRIRRISGTRIDTIAGKVGGGFSGDGGPALQATLFAPAGLAVATNGTVIFADSVNHRIRRLVPTATPVPPVAARLEARSGNNQTGAIGQLLPQALSVAVLSASNQPVAGTTITFTVTTGTAALSAASVNTGADGLVSITVTLSATVGPVQITARSGTLTPVVFSLTATPPPDPASARPIISRGGIIGVGFSVPAVTTISPRGIIAIAGQNFLEPGITGRRVDFATESINGLLPTRLLGVCVEIAGIRAPMLDVFGTQLDVVVPAVSGTSVVVRVIRRCDQPDAVSSDPETIAVAPAAPEFLYSQLNADGRNPVAAINAVTGALIGPGTLAGFTPAASGDILTLVATGFGGTNPAIVPGGTSTGIAEVTATVRLRIGTVDLAPADILYVGASPGSLIYQVNLRIPAGLEVGNLPVQIFLDGVASPPNAFLSVIGSSPVSPN